MEPYRIAKLAYDYSRNKINPLATEMSKEEVIEYIAMHIEQFAEHAYHAGRFADRNFHNRFDLWLESYISKGEYRMNEDGKIEKVWQKQSSTLNTKHS